MLRHTPAGGKACNGRQCFKWNTINYSSCYATSRACEVKRNSLEKWRKKASAQKLQGPSLHSAPGYFYSFYFPSNELFTFFFFPPAFQAPHKFALVLVSLGTGQKVRRRVAEPYDMCLNFILLNFNYRGSFEFATGLLFPQNWLRFN